MPKSKRQLDHEIKAFLRGRRPIGHSQRRSEEPSSNEIPVREQSIFPAGKYPATLAGYELTVRGPNGKIDKHRIAHGIRGIANYQAVIDSHGNIDLYPEEHAAQYQKTQAYAPPPISLPNASFFPAGRYPATLRGYQLTVRGPNGKFDVREIAHGIRGTANYQAVIDNHGNVELYDDPNATQYQTAEHYTPPSKPSTAKVAPRVPPRATPKRVHTEYSSEEVPNDTIPKRNFSTLPPGEYKAKLSGYKLTLRGPRGQTDTFIMPTGGIRGTAEGWAKVGPGGSFRLFDLDVI